MSLRDRASVLIGRLAAAHYRRRGRAGASVVAGRVARRLSPGVLPKLAAGFEVTLVSGTNGKTTTTRLLADALRPEGGVATNGLGANMPTGITAALVEAPRDARFAVAEVDERYLPELIRETAPAVVVLLNLSRDQLDRTPECRMIADQWRHALAGQDLTVVANSDDPWTVWAASEAESVVWLAVGQPWTEDSGHCPACGDRLERPGAGKWYCGHCQLRGPEADWRLEDDRAVHVTGRSYPMELALPGRVNLRNALMAMAVAEVSGVPAETALARIRQVGSVAGRYQTFVHRERSVRLLLVKNPAGWQETFDVIHPECPVLLAFNARELDGTDTSWLWDVDFTRLQARPVFVTGERKFDVAVRLHYSQVEFTVVDSLESACALLSPGQELDVAANYTAFLDVIRTVRTP